MYAPSLFELEWNAFVIVKRTSSIATVPRRPAGICSRADPAIAVSTVESPIGDLLVAVTPQGVVRLAFDPERVLEELAERISPRVVEAPARLDPVRRELDEYFGGRRRTFDLAVDWSLTSGFRRRVLEATARIPTGEVTTYGALARQVGKPTAARAVGGAVGSNPVAIVVPCHRVLPAAGGVGNYGGGPDRKEFLLELEGAR